MIDEEPIKENVPKLGTFFCLAELVLVADKYHEIYQFYR